MLEAFLQMQRLWIIDGTADFFRLQVLHQLITVALTDTDAILIEDMSPIRFNLRKNDRIEDPLLSEHFTIMIRVLLASFSPGIKLSQLHSQDSCLQRIKSAVHSDFNMFVLANITVDSKAF